MTRQPHLKDRVRARMAKTGERYAAARAHVVASGDGPGPAADGVPVLGRRHFPGVHPATSALRSAAHDAGLRGRSDEEPLSEALHLVVGGGIGAGVFAFRYEAEAVSTFFVAGRHRWEDDVAFLTGAARRLGLEPTVAESTSPGKGARLLERAVEAGPAIAWVDLAELGTRGYPAEWSGGGYHVVVVHGRDAHTGSWLIGDLTGRPVTVEPGVLARARARIARQRHCVMTVGRIGGPPDLGAAVRAGLRATIEALRVPRSRNFGLDAFRDWGTHLQATSGRQAWATAFPRGRRLWSGLRSIHLFVEHHGTGGGLLRPLFATGLREAAHLTGEPDLAGVADRYAALGGAWTDLARAALPGAAPLLAETRALQDRIGRRYLEAGPDALGESLAAWARLADIEREVDAAFPLDEPATRALLDDLGRRVLAIHAAEVEALAALEGVVGAG